QLRPRPGRRSGRAGAVDAPGPVQLHLRAPGRGHPGPGAAGGHRDRRGRVAGPVCPPRGGHRLLQGDPAGPLPRGAHPVSGDGPILPPPGGGVSDQTVAFAAELIDRSGKAPAFQAAYRRVRYCFGAIRSVMDPSALPKNRRLTEDDLKARTRPMTPAQAQAARGRLEAFINSLLEASISVLASEERAAFDGCTGL